MRKFAVVLTCGIMLVGLTNAAWAQCPEQPNDNGVCDTLYVECYDPFNYTPPPWQVRFPILFTNDIPDPATDSVAGMVISLCFYSGNPAANVRVDPNYNRCGAGDLYPSPDLDRSIFRHLPGMEDPQIRNWMMDLSEQQMDLEWHTRILDLGTHNGVLDSSRLALVPTRPANQMFCGGSRVLVATMTFTVDDTTTICLDTCFWPPTHGQLFARSDDVTYIPRDNMPYCASIRNQGCPGQDPNDNGDCDSLIVEVYPPDQSKSLFPAQVRLPIRVTNDIPNPDIDSITGMILVLGYSSSNPAANVWLDPDYNICGVQDLHPFPELDNSIFRHLPSMESPQERNWMMDLSAQGTGLEWDTRILGIDFEDKIFCAFVPTGSQDQGFCGGSQVLVATLTFTLEDTTTICIDTTFFPAGRHALSRSDAITYVPRDNMPYCESIGYAEHGDANGDGVINIADVMYMINYLYRGGPYPVSFEAGDGNCDDDHSLLDVVILINFLYKGGRAPGCI